MKEMDIISKDFTAGLNLSERKNLVVSILFNKIMVKMRVIVLSCCHN